MPETSLTVIGRVLREGGLIATGGRGLSAARMTSRDAASLLLGIAAQGDHTKAAEAVRAVGALHLAPWNMGRRDRVRSTLATDVVGARFGLHSGQQLAEALETILDRYSVEGVLPPEPRSPLSGAVLERRKSAGRFRALIEDDRVTDPTPCSVRIAVTRDADNYSAEITVGQRGRDFIELGFFRGLDPRDQRKREGDVDDGIESSLIVRPKLVHAIVCCVRDQSILAYPWRGDVE